MNNRVVVPYVNLALQHQPIKTELLEAIGDVIDSGKFILGDAVDRFERRFAELIRVRFAAAVNSGTDALILALRVLGVGQGDEVITAPNSFVASTGSIVMAGAKPVFVDVGSDYNIDCSRIERAITRKTKAILPVHLTGRPANMTEIMILAKQHSLHVIEDCAQAIMAEHEGKAVGSFGTVNCFSLHPLKTLNAIGDGGVLTTNDEAVYQQIKILRNLGLIDRDHCVQWSGNSRLDTIQAAVLLVKLKYLETWTQKRRANAKYYQTHLAHIRQIECPKDKDYGKSVYHTFVIQADERDALKAHLAKNGVGTAIHYSVPIHLHPTASKFGYQLGDFPNTEKQARHCLSLPIHHDLQDTDLRYVVDTIASFYGIHP